MTVEDLMARRDPVTATTDDELTALADSVLRASRRPFVVEGRDC
jgi:hypothetical protein